MAVVETVEQDVIVVGGVAHPVVVTRRVGLDTYREETFGAAFLAAHPEYANGVPFLCEKMTSIDGGEKMGVTRCYDLLKPPATPEQRKATLENVQRVVNDEMHRMGIW